MNRPNSSDLGPCGLGRPFMAPSVMCLVDMVCDEQYEGYNSSYLGLANAVGQLQPLDLLQQLQLLLELPEQQLVAQNSDGKPLPSS